MKSIFYCGLISFICFMYSCATVTQPSVVLLDSQSQQISKSLQGSDKILKRKVAIGRFSNETKYGKSMFADASYNMGKQAMDILSARLVASEKFIMLERTDLDVINKEMEMNNLKSLNIGADYLIIGSISEFGRNVTGEVGVFSRSKSQNAYAKVNIRLVDVYTGQLLYSEEGEGEAFAESSTVMGAGSRSGYDSSLNDKAISAAISKLVNNLIENLTEKPWRSYILDIQGSDILISGGKSQGISIGDVFGVYQKGKKITNAQTGMEIELPGKLIDKIIIINLIGNNINDEISFANSLSADLQISEPNNYYIEEISD